MSIARDRSHAFWPVKTSTSPTAPPQRPRPSSSAAPILLGIVQLRAASSLKQSQRSVGGQKPAPNKRLKLTGGDRFKGTLSVVRRRPRPVVHFSCAEGQVARSLSAIR